MNSRIETDELVFEKSKDIISEIKRLEANGELEMQGRALDRICYYAKDIETDRMIYFTENDDVKRIKACMIYDKKVKKYVNPDAVAEFIYNCIDVNALSCVEHICLLYDEPILDSNNEIEGYKKTKARKALENAVIDGEDEYAYEIGREQLGVVWVEKSIVILNISELVKVAEESSELFIDRGTDDESEQKRIFMREFEIALVSTICHEFRHAVYELNEFLPENETLYPALGIQEEEVEEYGNREMERLRMDAKARVYIDNMICKGE